VGIANNIRCPDRRHPDPQRARHPDRESVAFKSDAIDGGHDVRIARAADGMNGSHGW